MFARARAGLSLLSVCFLAIGCGPPTFAEVQDRVFTPRCANAACHGGDMPVLDLDLSEGAAYANTVGVPSLVVEGATRIVPGKPEESLLFQSVVGPVRPLRQMPVGFRLPEEELELLRAWIEAGAKP